MKESFSDIINKPRYIRSKKGKIMKNYTITVNGVAYISSITFNVEAMSSNILRFYKLDVTENYTYPLVNNNSVITFSAL